MKTRYSGIHPGNAPGNAIEIKLRNDNSILIQLSNKLYTQNSLNKILVSARDIIFKLHRPLSNINLIQSWNRSKVFAAGNRTAFISSLIRVAETAGEHFILSDIFNLSLSKGKIIKNILKEKNSMIIGADITYAHFPNAFSAEDIFNDLILCNKNIRKIADKLGREHLWRMLDLRYVIIVPFYNYNSTQGYFTIIGGRDDPELTEYDLEIFLSIRNIVSNAIINLEYKRLLLNKNRHLEEKNRELERKNREIEKIEQIERENLSELLHDTISQMIASTGISLNILLKEIKKICKDNITECKTEPVFKRISRLIADNKNILQNIKYIYKTYSPEHIIQKGLTGVLKENIADLEVLYNLQISYELPESELGLDAYQSSIIYKIIQECFYNIIKHSKAKKVILKIHENNNFLFIFLRDYGIGFDLSHVKDIDTKGIRGMIKKSKLLNGRFNIYTSANKGTIIYFKVPQGSL